MANDLRRRFPVAQLTTGKFDRDYKLSDCMERHTKVERNKTENKHKQNYISKEVYFCLCSIHLRNGTMVLLVFIFNNTSLTNQTFFTICIAFLVAFGFFLYSKNSHTSYLFKEYPTRTVILPSDYKITAYRATTNEEREQGLSGTAYLSPRDGMLFEFPYENQWYFWMKDMSIPIDIIWISKDMTVVHIEENLSPDTYPESFGPPSNALYVLETASGVVKKTNLKIGDKIIFEDK